MSFDNGSANTTSNDLLKSVCVPSFGEIFFLILDASLYFKFVRLVPLNLLQNEVSSIQVLVSYLWEHSYVFFFNTERKIPLLLQHKVLLHILDVAR